MLITIISVILALGFLIFIHELGHYWAAKKVGVHVMEFSIGFPPKLFSRIVGKTEYLISAIPIGGYVRLKGQSIDDEDPTDPENYASKTIWQRFQILVAGPMMNFLVTLILMPLVFYIGYTIPAYLHEPPAIGVVNAESVATTLDIRQNDLILEVNGKKVSTWREVDRIFAGLKDETVQLKLQRGTDITYRSFSRDILRNQAGLGFAPKAIPIIGSVFEGSPAEMVGIQKDDHLLMINDTVVEDWSQISPLVQISGGKALSLLVNRNGQELEFVVTPSWNESNEYWVIGVANKTIYISENLWDSVLLGTKRVYELTARTFEFLGRLISGKEKSDSVGGPIMIAKMMGQAAQTSASSLLNLVAFISLQFAIFNLLPIPALDGGHILFLLIEKVSGKSLSKKARMSIQRVGFSLLMALILYISIQDGLRLFSN